MFVVDDLFEDASPQCSSHSDTSSQSSSHSTGYSNLNYFSGDEHDLDISSKRRDQQSFNTTSHKSTRFCPQEKMMVEQYSDRNVHKQCKDKLVMDNRRLMRNRSLVDVRSQLLHRSLVEEVTKRRLSKTIGAVENIGFQAPCDISGKMSKPLSGAPSMRTSRDGKGKGPQKRRV